MDTLEGGMLEERLLTPITCRTTSQRPLPMILSLSAGAGGP